MYDKYQTGHTPMLMFISLVKIDEIHNREVNKRINKCFVIYKNVVFPNHVLTYTWINCLLYFCTVVALFLRWVIFLRSPIFFFLFSFLYNFSALFIILSANAANQPRLARLVILSWHYLLLIMYILIVLYS